MISWTSKGKEGDPIPWPYRPFCSICADNTQFVINPELGFRGATTFCKRHVPNRQVDKGKTRAIEIEEKNDVENVKSNRIVESDLLGKIYYKT